MVLALLTLEMRLQAHSLKQKRVVVKSVLNRLAQRHNLSVYEAKYHDIHNRALLNAAWVGPDRDGAQRILESALTMIELAGAEVMEADVEYF